MKPLQSGAVPVPSCQWPDSLTLHASFAARRIRIPTLSVMPVPSNRRPWRQPCSPSPGEQEAHGSQERESRHHGAAVDAGTGLHGCIRSYMSSGGGGGLAWWARTASTLRRGEALALEGDRAGDGCLSTGPRNGSSREVGGEDGMSTARVSALFSPLIT